MTVLKPRSRMISVRLSEDEYLALRDLCVLTGARSVSDLTRDAMHALLHSAHPDNAIPAHTDDLHAQVKSLNEKLEQLAAEFTSFKAATSN